MKYSIIKCINSNFTVDSEHSDLQAAKVKYHDVCKILWNAPDVLTAKIEIVDEQLNVVEDYREFIHHEQEEEPTAE